MLWCKPEIAIFDYCAMCLFIGNMEFQCNLSELNELASSHSILTEATFQHNSNTPPPPPPTLHTPLHIQASSK